MKRAIILASALLFGTTLAEAKHRDPRYDDVTQIAAKLERVTHRVNAYATDAVGHRRNQRKALKSLYRLHERAANLHCALDEGRSWREIEKRYRRLVKAYEKASYRVRHIRGCDLDERFHRVRRLMSRLGEAMDRDRGGCRDHDRCDGDHRHANRRDDDRRDDERRPWRTRKGYGWSFQAGGR